MAGGAGLAVGGKLTVTYIGSEPSTRGSDRKLYAASYAAPDGSAESGQFLASPETLPATPHAPAATAPSAATSSTPAATARELLTAGLSIEQVAAATGLAPTTVAALKNLTA
jgi:hypothetical protein